ncbi:hypothetical protein F4780DRAFT_728493 [Xylariomycetidae sp. FL0641]|nr:hypothetical protein F4780DRAFT_728493 [Xylariomycetidae sp. FL0641]
MASGHPGTSSDDKLPSQSWGATTPYMTASCHCGRVKVDIPSAPEHVNECRCSLCWKYGAVWAYYPRNEVTVTVAATDKDDDKKENAGLDCYTREDLHVEGVQGNIGVYRCSHCGGVTHWWYHKTHEDPNQKMGVNCHMLPESALLCVKRTINYC